MSKRIPREAFEYYCGLGSNRSYAEVSRHFGVTKQAVARRAQREKWTEQVEQIEVKARASVQQRIVESMEAMSDRHLQTARLAQRKGIETLRNSSLSPALAMRAIEIGIKQEREIRGASSDRSSSSTFTLPPLRTATDVATASAALLAAVVARHVTVEEGTRIGNLLELHRRALETADIETRLRLLENASAETGR